LLCLNVMAATQRSYWLIGVRRSELTASASPRFFSDMQHRLTYTNGKREGIVSFVRTVRQPFSQDLQRQHGFGYISFYYVDEILFEFAKRTEVKLNVLAKYFGEPPGAEVSAIITLPKRGTTEREQRKALGSIAEPRRKQA
jgi:hypothetical protein